MQRGSQQLSGRSWPALLALLLGLAVPGCGDDEAEPHGDVRDNPVINDPGPIHVHGLGINPADKALLVATHTGLFRAESDESKATRVGDRFQDTMGFTVVGPDRFLGSGHPDGREQLPPFLGLIRSDDGGRNWKPVSLLGKRDFHALEAAGRQVYGYGSDYQSREHGLLVSADAGRSWKERRVPEPFFALAADPSEPKQVAASGARGVYRSDDAGASWRQVHSEGGLVAWTKAGSLILVSGNGLVSGGRTDGADWKRLGTIGGQPAAFEAIGNELYVALHDGTIKRSEDGGGSWEVRSKP